MRLRRHGLRRVGRRRPTERGLSGCPVASGSQVRGKVWVFGVVAFLWSSQVLDINKLDK